MMTNRRHHFCFSGLKYLDPSDGCQFSKLSGEDSSRQTNKTFLFSVEALIHHPFLKMANCGNLLKCALVAIVLVALSDSGSAAEKLASCCKTVTTQEITEPVLGYLIQKHHPPCVRAVIFQTESGLFCAAIQAPWVRNKIMEFRQSQATTVPPSTVSLLSLITSSAPLPSSSTPLPSSSTSQEDSQ
ncbi:hypothetical protein INR49_012157 [Caranx melampygus]|nr:hypothetical protein INR49_012157 [Caranx melampygus]